MFNKSERVTETPGQKGTSRTTDAVIKEPVEEIITVGTKGSDQEVKKEAIPFDTKYQDDPNMNAGEEKVLVEGVEGEKTITYTYVTQSGKRVGNPAVDEKITKEKVDKVIARGIKGSDQEVKKEVIPFETKYQNDPEMNVGEEKVLVEGIEGEKTITSTYVTLSGKRVGDPKVTEEITKEKVDKVIARGTKGSDQEVKKEAIPFDTKYQDDPEMNEGEEKVLVEGVEGEKTITYTYVTQSGERVGDPRVDTEITKEKVDKVIARGIKGSDQEVKTEPIPFETKYQNDPTLKAGEEKVLVEGVEGETTITSTYVTLSGKRVGDPKVDTKVTKEKVDKVIARGTKGEDVVLKFVDQDDKTLKQDEVLSHDQAVGTDFKGDAPDTIQVAGKVYKFVGYKEGVDKVAGKVTDKQQVFTAVYAAPKELPRTNETNSARNTIIATVMSVLGISSLAAWFKFKK